MTDKQLMDMAQRIVQEEIRKAMEEYKDDGDDYVYALVELSGTIQREHAFLHDEVKLRGYIVAMLDAHVNSVIPITEETVA